MSMRARQVHPISGGGRHAAGTSLEHDQIAQLAYQLWQQRGCPIGSPEEDWYRAQQQLQRRAKSAPESRMAAGVQSSAIPMK